MTRKIAALLFGGIFFVGGISIFVMMVWPALSLAVKAQAWEPTSATVQSLKLHTHLGENGTTYKISGSYRYLWNGTAYTGNRFSLIDMSDNFGSFHQDQYRELVHAKNNHQPVMIWVDPANPSESIVNRNLRWDVLGFAMLFVSVFFTIGLAIILFTLKSGITPARAGGDSMNCHDKPWLKNKKWQSNTIFCNINAQLFVSWFFAIVCVAVSVPILNVIPNELDKGNYPILAALLFPLAGALLIWRAITETLRWRRFGKVPLIMNPFPGAIGGDIGGQFEISLPYDPSLSFKITVSCIHSYMSGTGKSRSRKESVIWQDDGAGEVSNFNGKIRVQFRFEIPMGLPQADVNQGERYHLWRLHTSCEMPGADLDRVYEIPVFPTGESSSIKLEPSREHESLEEAAQAGIEAFLQITHNRDGVELFMPMGSRIGGSVLALLVGLILLVSGFAVFNGGGPITLSGAFFIIGLLFTIGGMISCGTGLRTQFRPDGIYSVKYLYGVILGKKFIAKEQIKQLTVEESRSTKDGRRKTSWYTLKAVSNNDKHTTLAIRLKGRRESEILLESIKLLSGYP